MHHYRLGLKQIPAAYRAVNPQELNRVLPGILDEFAYVINHVTADHSGYSLMPGAYFTSGKVAALGARTNPSMARNAEAQFTKALQLDPSFIDPHSALAYLYLDTDRKDRAGQVVRAGLAVDGEHKALRRLADEAGIAGGGAPAVKAGPAKTGKESAPAPQSRSPTTASPTDPAAGGTAASAKATAAAPGGGPR